VTRVVTLEIEEAPPVLSGVTVEQHSRLFERAWARNCALGSVAICTATSGGSQLPNLFKGQLR
jgi:hypothetical protein